MKSKKKARRKNPADNFYTLLLYIMKVQIDTKAKVIRIEETVNLEDYASSG